MTRLNERGAAQLILLIAGIVVVIAVGAFYAQPQRFIVVDSTEISMSVGDTRVFTAVLVAKGWGFGRPMPIAGTITQRGGISVAQTSPLSRAVGKTGLTFRTVAFAGGIDTIIVTAASRDGTHDPAEVRLEVGP